MIFGSPYDSRRVDAGLCDRETVQAAKLRTMVPAMEVAHSGSPNGARRECGLGGENGFARRIRDIRSGNGKQTPAPWENKMSERNDFNQKVISEFRTNEGKVGGQERSAAAATDHNQRTDR